MKVNFMIIGAQKCGTTTLFEILKKHPGLVGSDPKEPGFFSSKELDFDYYHSLFFKNNNNDEVLYFEGSTNYTFYSLRKNEKIWSRIYDYNSEMKFIYIVRNPIDRMISAYMHNYMRGSTDLPVEQALVKERFYLDVTRYYTQIAPYIRRFNRENVLILDFDDLINNRKLIIEQVSEFLKIKADLFDPSIYEIYQNKSLNKNVVHHKLRESSIPLKIIRRIPFIWKTVKEKKSRSFKRKPQINEDLKKHIFNLLELEINAMEKLMKKNLGKWQRETHPELK